MAMFSGMAVDYRVSLGMEEGKARYEAAMTVAVRARAQRNDGNSSNENENSSCGED